MSSRDLNSWQQAACGNAAWKKEHAVFGLWAFLTFEKSDISFKEKNAYSLFKEKLKNAEFLFPSSLFCSSTKAFIFCISSSQSHCLAGNEAALTLVQYLSEAQETHIITHQEYKLGQTADIFNGETDRTANEIQLQNLIKQYIVLYQPQLLHKEVLCKHYNSFENKMQQG